MATFTMTIAEIMEMEGTGDVFSSLVHSDVVGLNTYPVIDESYRDTLNEKILRRFWNREIAHETVEEFRFRMQTVMGEIMPYYNDLLSTTRLEFDPMKTMDLSTVVTGKTSHSESATNLSTNQADSGSRTVNSIAPQMQLSGNGDYADTMADTNSESLNTSNANSTGEGSTSNENTSRTSGMQGIPADLLRKYRDTIINVDLMILDHLGILFMPITSTGSEYFYTHSPYYTTLWPWGYSGL